MLEQVKAKIRPMEYRAIVGAGIGNGDAGEGLADGEDRAASVEADLKTQIRELRAEQERSKKAFQIELNTVREEACEAGRRSAEEEYTAAFQVAGTRLADAVEEFRLSRDRYLAQVEREVVELALAVAERILHRQAQIDPLLLSGAVRVALGQLAESTEVRLKVPLAEREMWAEMLRLMPNLPLRPELTVDERMSAGECTIESHLGSVDIGVRAQLAEIERGFFDLLGHREQAGATQGTER